MRGDGGEETREMQGNIRVEMKEELRMRQTMRQRKKVRQEQKKQQRAGATDVGNYLPR